MPKKLISPLLLLMLLCSLGSCTSTKQLLVSGVSYQSIRTSFARPESIPADAEIAVEYYFDADGRIQPVVFNLTDKIMKIDQSKSFLVNTDGESISYFDPNVYSHTSGDLQSVSTGTSFNLGAITNALGIGGSVGALASGTTLYSGQTSTNVNLSTVAIKDQQQVTIAPKGTIALGKQFVIKHVGWGGIDYNRSFADLRKSESPLQFSVVISYSLDDTDSYEMLTTNFYVNSSINERVQKNKTSSSINAIYTKKPDALAEYMYMFLVDDNVKEKESEYDPWYGTQMTNNVNKVYMQGYLIDYK